jgi:hypothetical protein
MIHGSANKLVMLDPFLGIGHSALAAKQCKIRRFIGFDIDAEYVRVAQAALDKGLTEPTFDFPSEKGPTQPKAGLVPQKGRRGRKRKDDGAPLFNPPTSR